MSAELFSLVVYGLLTAVPSPSPVVLVPAAPEAKTLWRYSTERPPEAWVQPEFDDSGWQQGAAGFGIADTPGAVIGTTWKTPDIWLRTAFDFDGRDFQKAALFLHHDEDVTVYLNGDRIFSASGYTTDYKWVLLSEPIRKALRKGRNVLAVSCHQTSGGQYVDVSLVLDPKIEVFERPTLPPFKPLFDYPVRDPCICLGPDGNYYLTGTTGYPTWWKTNEGIRLWRSPDLKNWTDLGLVWKIEDGTWQKKMHGDRRALWAPEIHYLKGTFWLTYCMNFGGTGLLKSTTGKAEGPYIDVHPEGPLTGQIDASLFQDDDGKVYFLWQNGMIARMKDDMTGLAEKPRLLKPAHAKQVGFEGTFLTKKGDRYYLICADFIDGQYHAMAASAEHVDGPYGPRYLAIPHGGHNMLFTDKEGNWWSTFFGSDPHAPFRERPAILQIELDSQGRIRPKLP